MTTTGWLPAPVEDLFGPEATAEEAYDVLTVDVPPASWIAALEAARDALGCTYFDWLSAVDEPGTGFRVAAHVAALAPVRRLLVRTTVPHAAPSLPSAVGVYAGAAWHERETHEMFGVDFSGHPGLDHLLLPDTFEGHPLRKDFVLAARVAKAWPGAKEPGESEHGGPKRRQMLPPGVPDPNEWGPLKGQLPPAPSRPARGRAAGTGAAGESPARAAGGRPARAAGERPAGAVGERPVRRARTAAEGSASQQGRAESPDAGGRVAGAQAADGKPAGAKTAEARAVDQAAAGAPAGGPQVSDASATAGAAGPDTGSGTGTAAGQGAGTPAARRSRSASEGSASQRPAPGTTPPAAGPRRARSASQGSASQRAEAGAAKGSESGSTPDASGTPDADPGVRGTSDAGPDAAHTDASPAGTAKPAAPTPPRSSDAPWHHARPAYDEPDQTSETETAEPGPRRPPGPAAPERRPQAAPAPPGTADEPAATGTQPTGTRADPTDADPDSTHSTHSTDATDHTDSVPEPADSAPEPAAPRPTGDRPDHDKRPDGDQPDDDDHPDGARLDDDRPDHGNRSDPAGGPQ